MTKFPVVLFMLLMSCTGQNLFKPKDKERFENGDDNIQIPPLTVSITQIAPPSPSPVNNIQIFGSTRQSVIVEIFDDALCSHKLGQVNSDSLGQFSYPHTVTDNSSNDFYARSFDFFRDEYSTCSSVATYVEDSMAPSVPVFTGTTPLSPSSHLTPTVHGTADANETVQLFANNICSLLLDTTTANGAGNFSFNVTTAINVTSTYYANSRDTAGNLSSCTPVSVSYTPYFIPYGHGWFQGSQTNGASPSDINSPLSALEWNNNGFYDYDFYTHSTTTNPHLITVKQAGHYLVSYTIPMTLGDAAQRPNMRAEVYLNGVTIAEGSLGESGYIRNSSGHTEGSLHNSVVVNVPNPNDTLEVRILETSVAGVVNITNQATLILEYLAPSRNIFTASATRTVASTNFNQIAASSLQWSEGLKGTDFSHDNVINPENITINTSGWYMLHFNIPLEGTITRGNIKATVELNGVAVPGAEAKQGYIRDNGTHRNASLHWFGMAQITGGEVLTIKAVRESEAGTITVPTGKVASVFIEKIDDMTNALHLRTSTVAGGNWNPATLQNIQWDNTAQFADTAVFAHSHTTNNHQIQFLQGGDYILMYSDAFSTPTAQRTAPKITFELDGSPIVGAEVKTHYMRLGSAHNEASGTLYFYLRNVSPNQNLVVRTVQESVAGTVNTTSEATLFIQRRP